MRQSASPHRAPWVALMALTLVLAAAAAQAATPTQFMAKVYTEALGRIPDQGGWGATLTHFNNNGCSKSSLKSWGRTLYLSTEYSNLGYDNTSRLLTLYRGALNREPDSSGFNYWKGQLDGGMAWSSVVDAFFDSTEFSGLVYSICNQDSYGFGNAAVLDLPILGSGWQGTQSQLQSALNSTPVGGTLWLAQREVVRLTSTLTIPTGRTLATTGSPPHTKYANMARLVRNGTFNAPVVKLESGAKLKNVWVDGSRGRLGYVGPSPGNAALNVQLLGGTNTTVEQCRISNTAGWSSLQALGTFEGRSCGSNYIRSNLVTVYSSTHYKVSGKGWWADGLSIACENSTVEYNEVLDATDVPIVLFRATPAVQRSTVRYNTILNAGNSAYGGLVSDPLAAQPGVTCSQSNSTKENFTGANITNNTLWTGRAHYDIAISVGTRAWFGTSSDTGYGVNMSYNTSGTQYLNANTGIAISGMCSATVQSNSLLRTAVSVSACPRYNVAASVAAGWASGSLQPYTNVLVQGCIGH